MDDASRAYMLDHLSSVSDATTRAVVWLTLWEEMLDGSIQPTRLLDLAVAQLDTESEELNTQQILSYLRTTFWRFLTHEQQEQVAGDVEGVVWRHVTEAPSRTLKSAFFDAFESLAFTDAAVERLAAIWSGDMTIAGLPLGEQTMTSIAQGLAVRGRPNAEAILDRQRQRITNPDRLARFDFVRPALSANPEVRDNFFRSLADPVQREHEPWVLQGLSFLHSPLRAESSLQYIRPALDMLEEIQRTGDIFFPQRWIGATLGGHNSTEAADLVRSFLRERSDLPVRLRMKLLQSADMLFRSADIVGPSR